MRTTIYLILFLLTFSSFAQELKVLDKETGKPIFNVNVFTENPYFNSSTNSKGVVDISIVKEKDILIFSHISYALKSIPKHLLKNFLTFHLSYQAILKKFTRYIKWKN